MMSWLMRPQALGLVRLPWPVPGSLGLFPAAGGGPAFLACCGATDAPTTGPGGRSIQGDYRITAADPGRSLAFQVIAGPARPEGQYLLTESGDRTTVRFILDLKASGVMRFIDGFITKTMKAEVVQLPELKRVLEEA